ncbi:MAG: sugar nucleotide-binding protein, partial [Candidatus Diapherotrites archaeon]|nr:sugar nucleotide-binding protein [Candidatus Diapherotrites archaeon]
MSKPSKNLKKVLITGASSYVGARLFADLTKDFDVTGTYHQNRLFPELVKMDITDRSATLKTIEKIKPGWIVHVAANPFGGWCEENPAEAQMLNEAGTENIVAAANAVNAKIIYISSFAAINPEGVYAKTKRAGEEWAKKTNAGFVILRPSLIIGWSPNTTNDRPFNRMLKNITEQTPAVYDTSWRFQPTWLGHMSEAIRGIIQKGITSETIPIT